MTSAKSDFAKILDGVQAQLRPALKRLGFRARGRAFNRPNRDGLTEVIQLQMGAFDPPGSAPIPGFRENLYGKFTVNLGVFVPEVAEYQFGGSPKGFIQESQCCIRTRLGVINQEQRGIWWDITEGDVVVEEISDRLDRDGISFFSKFETRDAILAEWSGLSTSLYVGSAPRIICAIILAKRGAGEAANRLLAAQAREANTAHSTWVRNLARRLGVGELES
jgi:hypothetical protein